MSPSHHESAFIPVHPPSLENHHSVLHRQSRVLSSHTNQLISFNERLKALEDGDPLHEVRELERALIDKVNKVDTDLRIEVTPRSDCNHRRRFSRRRLDRRRKGD